MYIPEREPYFPEENREMRILLGWLDPESLGNYGTHQITRNNVGEMGNLLWNTFERLQSPKVIEEKGPGERIFFNIIQDQDDEKEEEKKELLTEVQGLVEEVAGQAGSKNNVISFAAKEALKGNRDIIGPLLKGNPGEQYIEKFTGVAYLIASVLSSKMEQDPNAPISLPKSGEGKGYLSTGIVILLRIIIARRKTRQA